jgi:large subunit ribosomal protein L3
VTVLHVDAVRVIAQRTEEKDGYTALQLGIGTRKPEERDEGQSRPLRKAGVEAPMKLAEFRVSPDAMVPPAPCCPRAVHGRPARGRHRHVARARASRAA